MRSMLLRGDQSLGLGDAFEKLAVNGSDSFIRVAIVQHMRKKEGKKETQERLLESIAVMQIVEVVWPPDSISPYRIGGVPVKRVLALPVRASDHRHLGQSNAAEGKSLPIFRQ